MEHPPGALSDPLAHVEAADHRGHEVERELAQSDPDRPVRRRERNEELAERGRDRGVEPQQRVDP